MLPTGRSKPAFPRTSTHMNSIPRGTAACLLLASLIGLAFVQQPQQGESANKVTLTKRLDNGAYKTSAYSFRYASQDLAVHRNHVDVVYDLCGCVHVAAHGGSKNTIARAEGKTLRDVKTAPPKGWQECLVPEKGAIYVLSIDTDETKMRVKLLVTDVSDKAVKFEWAQLPPASEAGTKGQCGGPHDAK
jgi:hypothetical protein